MQNALSRYGDVWYLYRYATSEVGRAFRATPYEPVYRPAPDQSSKGAASYDTETEIIDRDLALAEEVAVFESEAPSGGNEPFLVGREARDRQRNLSLGKMRMQVSASE